MAVNRIEPGFSGACECRCGEVQMRLRRRPIARFFCHCTICQRVYGREFGDPMLTWGFAVEIEDRSRIVFQRQRSIPFAVRCGTCRSCSQPVVGYTQLLPFIDLALVPGGACRDQAEVPAAVGHIFYECRARDVEDDLPKYSGFIASEWGFARFFLSGLMAGGSASTARGGSRR